MNIEDLILDTLESRRFADWYEKKFIPNYVEDRVSSKEDILEDISKLFDSKSMKAEFFKEQKVACLSEEEVILLRGALGNDIENTKNSIARVGAEHTYQHTILRMYEDLLSKLGGKL